MTKSVLDDVPGLGPTRRRRVLKEFGSVKKLREQELETLLELTWLPDTVGRALFDALHGGPALGTTPDGGQSSPGGLPSLGSS